MSAPASNSPSLPGVQALPGGGSGPSGAARKVPKQSRPRSSTTDEAACAILLADMSASRSLSSLPISCKPGGNRWDSGAAIPDAHAHVRVDEKMSQDAHVLLRRMESLSMQLLHSTPDYATCRPIVLDEQQKLLPHET